MPTNQYVEDTMLRVVLLVKRGPFSKSVATIMEVGTPVCRTKYVWSPESWCGHPGLLYS